jgi:hypothetical protein
LAGNDEPGHGAASSDPDTLRHHHHIMVECELEEPDEEILLGK